MSAEKKFEEEIKKTEKEISETMAKIEKVNGEINNLKKHFKPWQRFLLLLPILFILLGLAVEHNEVLAKVATKTYNKINLFYNFILEQNVQQILNILTQYFKPNNETATHGI